MVFDRGNREGKEKETETIGSGSNDLECKLTPFMVLKIYNGEFDPGSERTLAARFKHASRTVKRCLHLLRVANG